MMIVTLGDTGAMRTSTMLGWPKASASPRLPQDRADDQLGGFLGAHRDRVDADLGLLGRLIGRADAGKVGNAAVARFGVEALGIAPLGFLERRIDVDLDE